MDPAMRDVDLEEQLPISHEQKLPLFLNPNKPNAPNEYLTLNDDDPIFATSFEMLIKECFRDNKHFILAKMQTRSVTSYKQSHSHFYNAYGILGLIYQKRRDEIVGRFHHLYPISAKNPMTNQV